MELTTTEIAAITDKMNEVIESLVELADTFEGPATRMGVSKSRAVSRYVDSNVGSVLADLQDAVRSLDDDERGATLGTLGMELVRVGMENARRRDAELDDDPS